MAAMLVVNQTQNEKDLFRTTHTSFLQFIVPPSFKGEDFFIFQPIRIKKSQWRPCF
jgi:hypothetical protein